MKYSIIIPVYNVEKYLEKCLKSILKQNYKNYEIILIDDCSTDNSKIIINKYEKIFSKKLKKIFLEKNCGQSEARNIGVNMSTGDYIFFIDSDDYIDDNLLENINNEILKNIKLDLLRIPKRNINGNDGKINLQDKINTFNNLNGKEAFIKIRRNRIGLEVPWAYIIRRDYWVKNNFKFCSGRVHEDFGLIPLVLIKASKVSAIASPFYNHVIRENSTMTQKNYIKILEKAYDVIYHYDFLLNAIDKEYRENDLAKKEYIQYITDKVFGYLRTLKEKDKKQYKSEIHKRKMISRLKIYSMKSALKKILYIFYMCYYR